ncbi:MAG: potassium transporter TrkA [Epsilonproteobacteria bacterium]|nr:potassium transporter TrkA [Campylobacterota bacterium]
MKKILILADGILAKYFLQRVMESQYGENSYDVVYYNEQTLPQKASDNFRFFDFDPTSYDKLIEILDDSYYQVMVIVSKKIDATSSYKNIRKINKDIQIVLLDKWGMQYDDKRLYLLNSTEALASRFIDYLPDMPVIAQNVGLGKGEIMEVRIPSGSSYSYRHLGNIVQKNWKIAGIYRANNLILPRDSLMIQPNDILLVVGDPHVLISVYHSAKKEIGQFPYPFGKVIYCFINMQVMSDKSINTILNDAMLLHTKINSKKLFIRVINPTISKLFDKIKSYLGENIDVQIDYHNSSTKQVMTQDIKDNDIGLLVVKQDFFAKYTKTLFELRKPIFKIGIWGFPTLQKAVIVSNDSADIEKESAVIFDFSSQLDLKIKLYNFYPNGKNEEDGLSEHFNNLAKIFNKKIQIINSQKNPLVKLRNQRNIMQFVPFTKKVVNQSIFSIFSTDMEKLYFKLSDNYQVFIPVTAKN